MVCYSLAYQSGEVASRPSLLRPGNEGRRASEDSRQLSLPFGSTHQCFRCLVKRSECASLESLPSPPTVEGRQRRWGPGAILLTRVCFIELPTEKVGPGTFSFIALGSLRGTKEGYGGGMWWMDVVDYCSAAERLRRRREAGIESHSSVLRRFFFYEGSRSWVQTDSHDERRADPSSSQTKYTTSLREHTATMTHMQRELESLRTSEKALRTTLRDMELDNDVLENSERCVFTPRSRCT